MMVMVAVVVVVALLFTVKSQNKICKVVHTQNTELTLLACFSFCFVARISYHRFIPVIIITVVVTMVMMDDDD